MLDIKSLLKTEISLGDINFEEAEKHFRNKIPITSKEFEKLKGKNKELAFTIANFTNADMIKEIYEIVLECIEDGKSISHFKEKVNNITTIFSAFRLETIYRQNMQTAYQVGHYERMTDSDIISYRPYWQYDAVLDKATRPEHKALDGKIFKADDPFWDTWYPPNGFNCRCTVKALSERDFKKIDGEVLNGDDIALMPDKNFNYNPALKEYKPDIEKLPTAIKKAYLQNSF